jgi:hypothetical protein
VDAGVVPAGLDTVVDVTTPCAFVTVVVTTPVVVSVSVHVFTLV